MQVSTGCVRQFVKMVELKSKKKTFSNLLNCFPYNRFFEKLPKVIFNVEKFKALENVLKVIFSCGRR